MTCTVTYQQGGLLVQTPYDPGFVAMIKNLPARARKFDPANKAWLVDPQYAGQVKNIIGLVFNEQVSIPSMSSQVGPELRALEVRYLGATKDRGDGDATAFGWCNGEWSVIFPESVLRQWFEGLQVDQPSAGPATLYAILGIKQDANADDVKSAFRRMARQWHPDHCKEPDAAERFIKIKDAYDLLSNSNKRARYDAGLSLEASLNRETKPTRYDQNNYRAPLRCGYVLCEGTARVGRFVISKILDWADIVDNSGRTLVVSWPRGADRPVEQWV